MVIVYQMHEHRPDDPAAVLLNVSECLPLITGLRVAFLKLTNVAQQVKPETDANALIARVDATLKGVQTQVMLLLKQACPALIEECVASEVAVKVLCLWKVPALFDGSAALKVFDIKPEDVMSVISSAEAGRFKKAMGDLFALAEVSTAAVTSLDQLGQNASALDDIAHIRTADMTDMDKTFVELAVMQNTLRPLEGKESRQALALQAQLLISKKVKPPMKINEGIAKLLDRALSAA